MVGWRLERGYWQGGQAAICVMWVSVRGFTDLFYRRKPKAKSKLEEAQVLLLAAAATRCLLRKRFTFSFLVLFASSAVAILVC
jgi:hypothetical protein